MPRSDGCVYSSLEVEVGDLPIGAEFRLDGRRYRVTVNDGQRYLIVDEIGHTNTVHLDCETLVRPID